MAQINPMKEKMALKMNQRPVGQEVRRQNDFTGFVVDNHPDESKSGTCALCKKLNHGLKHGLSTQKPPYHANCKCSIHGVK